MVTPVGSEGTEDSPGTDDSMEKPELSREGLKSTRLRLQRLLKIRCWEKVSNMLQR